MTVEPRTRSIETLSLPVEGMNCASCVKRVETAAAKVPGVAEANVNLANETLTVTVAPGFAQRALSDAIEAAGYFVPTRTVEIGIEGMSCASCVKRVEKAIAAVPGVVSAAVNLASTK